MSGVLGRLNQLEKAIKKRFAPPAWKSQLFAYTEVDGQKVDLFAGIEIDEAAFLAAANSGAKIVFVPGNPQI